MEIKSRKTEKKLKQQICRLNTEPRKGHFLSDIYQKRNWNKEIRTEIKAKNISYNRLIISLNDIISR